MNATQRKPTGDAMSSHYLYEDGLDVDKKGRNRLTIWLAPEASFGESYLYEALEISPAFWIVRFQNAVVNNNQPFNDLNQVRGFIASHAKEFEEKHAGNLI